MTWNYGKVEDIAIVISGFAFKSEWFGEDGANLKVIRIGDLQNNEIVLNDALSVNKSNHKISNQYEIKCNDILMALSGATVGKIAVAKQIDEGSYINQRVAIIRGKRTENSKYLRYVFDGELLSKLLMSAGGAAQPNLSPKDLAKMEIPLPPLAEQQRIAAILDKAEEIKRKREQAIAKLDELAQSTFVEMFGDPSGYDGTEITLGECLTFINGRAYSQHELLNSGTPIIRIQNLNGGSRWFYSNLMLPTDKYCDQGDLLFAWSATFGPYIWHGSKSIYHYHIWKVVPSNLIDKQFAYYLLKSITQQVKDASHGASMLHMTKGGIEAWKIKLPTIEHQLVFSSFIKKLNELNGRFGLSKNIISENLASLQHQAFTTGFNA
ncbi:HsdS Restriction endonuclease S subunits [Burkholderiaceae bacterium]